MSGIKEFVALFDLDGVVFDTESQYSNFWDKQGELYLHKDNFCAEIKGQTLTQIYTKYFHDNIELQKTITIALYDFEHNMVYDYIPGAYHFLCELSDNHVRTGIVTSSDEAKMANVYRVHPEVKQLFNVIVTANMITKSKPNPECFLKGMELLHSQPSRAIVFEDSFHGLQAGRTSGAFVVGLATTNSREAISDKADYVIDNFQELNVPILEEQLNNRL